MRIRAQRYRRVFSLMLGGCFLFAATRGLAQDGKHAGGTMTIEPSESKALILNPGMGWVVYGEAETFDEKTLSYASVGYKRFDWSQLQPKEDEFNWEPIEVFLKGWRAKGKPAAFGVMAASSHSQDPFVTPKWVFDAGAEYKEAQVKNQTHGREGKKVVPDFDHPVFLNMLDGFLKALAKKYDGDPCIAFLDIRSYGNWGEAHMSYLGQYPPISDEMFCKHVELHRDAFKQTQLLLPLNDGLRSYKAVATWAVENGIGVRRDGVMGNSDGSETAIAHGKEPGCFEWYQNYEYLKKKGWWYGSSNRGGYGYPLADCVERGHPSWVQMGYWGGKNVAEFLAAEKPLIDKLSNRIGYRLVLTQARLPKVIVPGTPSELTISIANRGVADFLLPCHVAFGLLDNKEKIIARAWATGAKPTQWKSDRTAAQTLTVNFGPVRPGSYHLCLGLFTDRKAKSPDIAMAIEGVVPDRWHPLSDVHVQNDESRANKAMDSDKK